MFIGRYNAYVMLLCYYFGQKKLKCESAAECPAGDCLLTYKTCEHRMQDFSKNLSRFCKKITKTYINLKYEKYQS